MFFVNEIEAAQLAAGNGSPYNGASSAPLSETLDKLTERFPQAEIILTAGKDGAYYGYGKTRAKGDIVEVPVIDSTGAGDTFTGYFIAAREKKMDVSGALALACKAASIAVSRPGAMEAIPYGWEVFGNNQ